MFQTTNQEFSSTIQAPAELSPAAETTGASCGGPAPIMLFQPAG